MCVILAFFVFCNNWEDIHMFVVDNYNWSKTFLQMTDGIPAEKSHKRIMALIDKDELNNILFNLFKSITNRLNPEIDSTLMVE